MLHLPQISGPSFWKPSIGTEEGDLAVSEADTQDHKEGSFTGAEA
jgi:hypothetical protein